MSDSPYRAAPPPPVDTYAPAWRELRRRHAIVNVVRNTAFVGIAISLSFSWIVPRLVTLVALVALLPVGIWAESFRCPRCRWPFGQRWWKRSLAKVECARCGLPIGQRATTSDVVTTETVEETEATRVRIEADAPVATEEEEGDAAGSARADRSRRLRAR